jgi:hypothetical protein
VRRTPPNTSPLAALRRVDRIGARVVVAGLVWLTLLAAPALYVQARAGDLTGRARTVELTLGTVALIATIGFGCYMGVRRCRFLEVLAAAALGAAALMSIYLIAWLEQPDPNSTNDNAAVIGLVIIGPPVLLIVLALLGAGALAGRVISRRSRRLAFAGGLDRRMQ